MENSSPKSVKLYPEVPQYPRCYICCSRGIDAPALNYCSVNIAGWAFWICASCNEYANRISAEEEQHAIDNFGLCSNKIEEMPHVVKQGKCEFFDKEARFYVLSNGKVIVDGEDTRKIVQESHNSLPQDRT